MRHSRIHSLLASLLTRAALLLVILCFAIGHSANATPLSGTKSVGPTGNYASLTAAVADVQAQTLGGALVLELQATYVSTVETFPLTIPALNGASATNTLTIRPATGATALSITSNNGTATVDLNGTNYVILDGRPGGAGTAKQLTIANTGTTGAAVRFINGASNELVQYVKFQGMALTNSVGVIFFATASGSAGNQNSTIDHCDIGDAVTTPTNAVYSSGTAGTLAQYNSGNTISNCNIFNFYAASNVDSAGVWLDTGNTGWTITGNSFYQTASRASVSANVRAIFINNTSGNNFTVSSNFIGGSAASAGGSAWTATNTGNAFLFTGIQLNVGTATPSSVQGNTIANIVWTSSSTATTLPGLWSGMYVQAGAVNIGTVTGNTIGSGTGTGSVFVTTQGNGGTSFGIGSASSGTVAIANNTIGSITVNGSSTSVSASLTGIQVTAGTNTISNNIVGNTGTPSPLTSNLNSLNAATSSTSVTGQQITGILSSSSISANITGNTVANLNNNYVGTATAGQILGIVTNNGVNTITGNTVRNLSTTSQNASATVVGVFANSFFWAGQTVSQNTVHSLASTAASAAVSVTGIYYYGPTSGTNIIARNLAHSLAIASTSTSSRLYGMYFDDTCSFTVQNNMVRVGLNASGTSTAGASSMYGILDNFNGTSASRNFYHNSVYLGGTQTSGANNTRAFTSTGSINARAFQNNIFVNARSNSGATGKHYAVIYGGSGVKPAGLTAGANLFFVSGTGGVLGRYNGADAATLAAWQSATGQDATSAVADPLFIAPTGSAATVDLHLQASNPAEGQGIPIAAVTDDFDGQTRSTLMPADVGADAGNFTLSSDVFAPIISYPLLSSGSTANRVLIGWATITDTVGVSGGASAPRLYFKKSTDADVFGVANNSTGNGWKYVTATGSGPYSFTLDYSLLYNSGGGSGSVIVGDSIQYFVVAQDAANNLGSSPTGTAASLNPPVQNVNSHGAVNSFSIAPISGTVTIGSGGTYPSLSGAGGFFAALNGMVLTGNVVANITSDVTEDGSVTLNEFATNNYPPSSTYTLTIQPDSATMRTISGSAVNGLITLNGADRVTIDGRFGGSGRYLTFRNTSTGNSASTLLFINDASNNTVRNCVVEGAGTFFYGVISFRAGSVTGNDNNLITGCQVRDLSTAAGVPFALIGSDGYPAVIANSNNTISNNELFNFSNKGIYIDAIGDSWTISSNDIHEVNTATGLVFAIDVRSGGSNVIMGNSLHDLNTTDTQSVGIYVNGAGTTTISRNRFTAFTGNGSSGGIFGIWVQGSSGSTLNVLNNQITVSPATSISTLLRGIYDGGSTGSVVNVFYNSVLLGGTESGTASSWASFSSQPTTHTERDNLFLNLRTNGAGGTGSHFAAGSEGTGGSFTASNNVYAGTGATAANFMDLSATSTPVPMSFAAWQSSTGDNNSQAGIAGSGSFTAAMFVSAATGDLHLVPGGNVLVNGTGTAIAGVTDDYDGNPRPLVSPNIGSDEYLIPDIAIEQPVGNGLTDGVSTKDFGPATVNDGIVVASFKITNSGTANLTGLVVTLDGANAGEFGTTQPASTTLAPGASTFFNVSFAPTVAGARNAAIHVASNVTGTKNPFDIALTGTGITAQENWRLTFYGTTSNTGNAADNADPYHTGVPNLAVFALLGPNQDPAKVAAGLLPQAQIIGANYVISFTQPAGVSGVTYGAEWRADLSSGTWTPIADTGTGATHTFSVSIGRNTQIFMRLKVTSP